MSFFNFMRRAPKLKLNINKKVEFPDNFQVFYCKNNINDQRIEINLKELNYILSSEQNKLLLYFPKYTKLNDRKLSIVTNSISYISSEFKNFNQIYILSLISKQELDSFFKSYNKSKKAMIEKNENPNVLDINFLLPSTIQYDILSKNFGRKEIVLLLDKDNKIIYFSKKDVMKKILKILLFGSLLFMNFVYIPYVQNFI